MIEPKPITIKDMNGQDRNFVISKMPYYPAREVVSQFVPTLTPKVGNYKENEKLSLLMMKYVAVVLPDGQQINLVTQALVENHVDLLTGGTLEKEMLEYNAGFFLLGAISTFFGSFRTSAEQLISKISMGLQERSSQREGRPSTNSKRSTRSKTHS